MTVKKEMAEAICKASLLHPNGEKIDYIRQAEAAIDALIKADWPKYYKEYGDGRRIECSKVMETQVKRMLKQILQCG